MMRILVLVALLLPALAHASTSSCQGIGDGTACTTQCISMGACHSGVCVPQTVRPNGSFCSSENKCTINDTCQSGECVPGGAIMCPAQDACHRGQCVPNFGCIVVTTCHPDFAMPPEDMAQSPPDLSLAPSDMSVRPTDAGLVDMSFANPDACFMPPGSEFLVCPGDGGPIIVSDLGRPDSGTGDLGTGDMEVRFGHLRGSRPGDCGVVPGTRPSSPLVLAVSTLLLAVGLRRRRA